MNGLKFFRNYCYVSTNELAEKLGVSRALITMWENGQKELPEKRAEEIAEIFGIEKQYLYEIEEEDVFHYVEFCERFYNKEKDAYKVTRGDDWEARCLVSFDKDYDVFQMEAETRKETNEFLEKMRNILTKPAEFGKVSDIYLNRHKLDVLRPLLHVLEKAYNGNQTEKSFLEVIVDQLCRVYNVENENKLGKFKREVSEEMENLTVDYLQKVSIAAVKECRLDIRKMYEGEEMERKIKQIADEELKAFEK